MEKTKKKRCLWWLIPAVPVALILIVVLAATIMLGNFKNVIAMTSNFQLSLSEKTVESIQGGVRDYSTLPALLQMSDGTAVTDADGFAARRAEILALFESEVYGVLPKEGFEVSFNLLEEGEALGGAAIRRQIEICVTTEKGTSTAIMLIYIPKSEQPVPVVVGLNFLGNHTVLDDDKILPSASFTGDEQALEGDRGTRTERWAVEMATRRGCAIASIYCNDFSEDNAKKYADRVISLFDEPEFKSVSAWAFGIMRAVDYLSQTPEFDQNAIACIGHSRLGKAAIWAGANDERIALVISNDSGNTGSSMSRGNMGETVKSINIAFPHWFCSNYATYGGKEDALPVDQNMLLACIAPRTVYVACAQGDLWADPMGSLNCLQLAKPAFELYGLGVIPDMSEQPPVGQPVYSEGVAYHIREGWHNVLAEDWEYYLDYIEEYL